MTSVRPLSETGFPHPHLLGIEGLTAEEITFLLDLGDRYVELNRTAGAKHDVLAGLTVINLFFETSTRTRTSTWQYMQIASVPGLVFRKT